MYVQYSQNAYAFGIYAGFGVSLTRGPQTRPPKTMILAIGTLKKERLIVGTPHVYHQHPSPSIPT